MTIRIGHLSTAYHTSLVLMGKEGWARDAGLSLKWSLYPTGPRIIDDLEEGRIDLGYVGLPPAIIGIDRGAELKCIAGGHVEGTALVAGMEYNSLQEAGHDEKAALEQFGTIGSPSRGSIHDVIIRDSLEEAGLSREVEVKNYPWADLVVVALERGEIDAAVGTPALAVAALHALEGKVVFRPQELWPFNPSYGIVAREDAVSDFPEEVEGFLLLHRRACTLTRENPSRAAETVSGVLDVVGEEFVSEVLSLSPRYCTALPREYIASTLAFVDALRALGYIQHTLGEEDIFDRRFVEMVHPEAHHY